MERIIKQERDMKLRFEQLISKKINHKCLHPECNEDAISSHSISKSTLKNIDEDNHLIHQKFDRADFKLEDFSAPKKINMTLKKISILKSSTFKGFCKLHDNDIFKSIDDKKITTLRDIILQFYRTSSKKLFLNNMALKAELDIYQKEYYYNTQFENNKLLNLEKIVLVLENLLTDYNELDQIFKIKSNEVLWIQKLITTLPFDNDVNIMFKEIDTKYPMALESSYTLSLNNAHHNSIVIILPTKTTTIIGILCHKDAVTQYTPFLQSDLKILNFIESTIMGDAEFYINPNIFNKFSKEKVDLLEKDLYFFNERSFLEEYDISIFDEIRFSILEDETEDIVNHEKKKLTIPKRISLEKRLWNLGQFIEKNRRNQSNTNKLNNN